MCEVAYSDTLPHCGVTSCLDVRDILPLWSALPHQESDLAFFNKHRLWVIVVFPLCSLFIYSHAPKRQGAPIMHLKDQIPGEAI